MSDTQKHGSANAGTGRLAALNAQVPSLSAGEVIGLLLSGLWLAGCILFFMVLGFGKSDGEGFSGSLQFLMTLVAVIMPVAVIWVAVAALRSARIMRDESARLSSAIDAMRSAYIQQQQGFTGSPAQASKVEQKLEEIAQVGRKTEAALATFTSIRPGMPTLANPALQNPSPAIQPAQEGEPAPDQTSLALGTTAEELTPPLSVEDFIRALHFPETAEDAEGFSALRRALDDRQVAGLVQAAQDVLTLLSQDGIYMDDLRPDRARPEIWRKFAAGDRGRSVAALGGVRDRSSLALSAGRMKQDPIFRDAAHHFLRRFDQTFAGFEKNASDADIAALADTRTARAFMLLGRVTGTFD